MVDEEMRREGERDEDDEDKVKERVGIERKERRSRISRFRRRTRGGG